MRIHQLENDLITLNPSDFESLNEFFSKFKNLIYQLKQCKVKKDETQLILAILTKLNSDYSVFVSTFQTVRLTTPNWKMPTLNDFIQSLISENDKLIQMGIIRSPKDLALIARGDKVANDRGKQRDESEQSKEPSSSKRSKKNSKGKILCPYCGRGFHSESSCMRRQLDEMALLLKNHNISVLGSARKYDSEEEEDEEYQRKGHALKACYTSTHVFLIDSRASNHMAASIESFSSF